MSGGSHYTVVALPDSKKAILKVLSDNLTPPSEGKAKVRVINAAPDAGDVDIFGPDKKDSLSAASDSSPKPAIPKSIP